MSLKNKYFATKKFVADHKVLLTALATATVCTAINQAALKQHNDFLKEKGLYEEFYTPDAEV